jgi:hypothetical protein
MKTFIWTEAIGCAEILGPMIKSFSKHHKHRLHIYIYDEDLKEIEPFLTKNVIAITIPQKKSEIELTKLFLTESELREAYKNGHNGTAKLWSHVIKSRDEQILIHLDSDTIFVREVISKLESKLASGYGIVGSRRPYRKNIGLNGFLNKVRHYLRPDAVNTHCFGFRRDLIAKFNTQDLELLILGKYSNRFKRIFCPIIDFFDELTFLLRNKGGIFYLDSSRQSRSGKHDRLGEFENSMISFSAVGSGCVLFKNPNHATSDTYRDFALSSYSLFCNLLLEKKLEIPPLDSPFLKEKISRLNLDTWQIQN